MIFPHSERSVCRGVVLQDVRNEVFEDSPLERSRSSICLSSLQQLVIILRVDASERPFHKRPGGVVGQSVALLHAQGHKSPGNRPGSYAGHSRKRVQGRPGACNPHKHLHGHRQGNQNRDTGVLTKNILLQVGHILQDESIRFEAQKLSASRFYLCLNGIPCLDSETANRHTHCFPREVADVCRPGPTRIVDRMEASCFCSSFSP